eukprot:5153419-Alexandrium_andersonii.AAC.1
MQQFRFSAVSSLVLHVAGDFAVTLLLLVEQAVAMIAVCSVSQSVGWAVTPCCPPEGCFCGSQW